MYPKVHKTHAPEAVAAMYVEAQKGRHQSISMKKAIRALRAALPRSHKSDNELADLVTNAALDAGVAVDFDEGLP
ncbi:hypothetical protein J1C56_27415 [Aminobacter anthyllidis]|uniref:Uncharacterized protein n=1 Tax=Aminobacter anthyllidis TaxID=1035067 RepID=A0A9X1AG33_9HYPH|nr:hypothetical protein [Aminobacter anthyllidis]MBT1159310.1 hypothetical protein [Aminobacter anthyllidis]